MGKPQPRARKFGAFLKKLRRGRSFASVVNQLGIDMSERGVDLQDVGAALGHASIQTTRSAYVPILSSRMQRASDALAGRLSGWKKEPEK